MRFKLGRGSYTGRLAFDPDTGFHVATDGRKVVTDDAGKTWRYATRSDTSHNHRYSKNVVEFTPTSAEGHVDDPDSHGHHWAPRPDDPHVDGVVTLPDDVAERATSHTGAWQ